MKWRQSLPLLLLLLLNVSHTSIIMACTFAHSLLLLLLLPLLPNLVDSNLMASPAGATACNYSIQTCGDIPIPYPFGMHPNCGLPDFRINCTHNASLGSGLLPFLQLKDTIRFQVLTFSPGFLIINATHFKAASCESTLPNSSTIALPDQMPFRISSSNIFAAIGCRSWGNFTASIADQGDIYQGGCSNPCYNTGAYDFCNYYACCTVVLPSGGATAIQIYGAGIAYTDFPGLCGFSMVLDPGTYKSTQPGVITAGNYGLMLSWGIPFPDNSPNCSSFFNTTSPCTENSKCLDLGEPKGYACNCTLKGYRGDGYKNGAGCEDIDECSEGTSNCVGSPYGTCENLAGGFKCKCIDGAQGNGISLSSNGTGCTIPKKTTRTSIVITATILSTAAALLFTCLLAGWIYNWRTSRVKKAMYFERNGGIRLKEYISVTRGRDAPRLFSEAELQKATQNFAGHLELGRGGYGSVYKGVLADASVVAIKKAHVTEQQEADQFINEVIILSQINHRNIVQLLGCCLETPVPILVYEYVPNGTLSEHLHRKVDGRSSATLSWENRLAIALESAEAIAYLHSSISTPIYHRDIKSSNILLDKALTPKVSDFGISRLLRMDETHVSTVVKGTMGYLDPEYFQSFQLTDKSDVYSFGVVLLELITSLKPILATEMSGRTDQSSINLATLCISSWKKGSFSTLIDPALRASVEDPRVMGSVNRVAKLAVACLCSDPHKRPSMKEVLEELLWIRGSKEKMVGAVYNSSLEGPEEDEEAVALLQSSQKLIDSSSFCNSYSSGASTSHASTAGLQELEMAMISQGGR